MHARLRNSFGTRSSKAPGMTLVVHQHGPLEAAGEHNWQAFGSPHKGQRVGSGGNVFTNMEAVLPIYDIFRAKMVQKLGASVLA
jgi:hypothetical protein